MLSAKNKKLQPKARIKQGAAKSLDAEARGKTVSLQWVACLLLLLGGIFYSGLQLVQSADEMRFLYRSMDELQSNQDVLLANYSRLLLERSTLASMQTVEAVATTELQMFFPETIVKVSN
jgi:cell division protein FtsL